MSQTHAINISTVRRILRTYYAEFDPKNTKYVRGVFATMFGDASAANLGVVDGLPGYADPMIKRLGTWLGIYADADMSWDWMQRYAWAVNLAFGADVTALLATIAKYRDDL